MPNQPIRRVLPSAATPVFWMWNMPSSISSPVLDNPQIEFLKHGHQVYPNARFPGVALPPAILPANMPPTDAELESLARQLARQALSSMYFLGYWQGYGNRDTAGKRGGGLFIQLLMAFDGTPAGSATTLFSHPSDAISNTTPVVQGNKRGQVGADPGWPPFTAMTGPWPNGLFSSYCANGIANVKKFLEWFLDEYKSGAENYVPPGGGAPVKLQYPYYWLNDVELGNGCPPDARTLHYTGIYPTGEHKSDWKNHYEARTSLGVPTSRYTTEVIGRTWENGVVADMTMAKWRTKMRTQGIWTNPDESASLVGNFGDGVSTPFDQATKRLSLELFALQRSTIQYAHKIAVKDVWEAAGYPVQTGNYDMVEKNPNGPLYTHEDPEGTGMVDFFDDIQHPVLYYYIGSGSDVPMSDKITEVRNRIRSCKPGRPIMPYIAAPMISGSPTIGYGGEDLFVQVLLTCWQEGIYEYILWGYPGSNWDEVQIVNAINYFKQRIAGVQRITRTLPMAAPGPRSPLFHSTRIPEVGVLSTADDLIEHPNYRQQVRASVRDGEIDNERVPGGLDMSPGYVTPRMVALRCAEYAHWQGWLKGSCTQGPNKDYEGSYNLLGAGMFAPGYMIYGSEADRVLGSSTNPLLRYSPFAAASLPLLTTRSQEIAQALKSVLDGGYNGSDLAYPAQLDLEIGGWETIARAAFRADWRDTDQGSWYQNKAGSFKHGFLAFSVTYTGGDATALIRTTGEAGSGQLVLYSNVAGTTNIALNGSSTVQAVVNAINAVSGWSATKIADGSCFLRSFGGDSGFNVKGTANTQYLWSASFVSGTYDGWLQTLLLSGDPRLATETVYETWNGTAWLRVSFLQWWASVGQPSFDPSTPFASQPTNVQNAIADLVAKMAAYRIRKAFYDPFVAVFPAMKWVSEKGLFSADPTLTVGNGKDNSFRYSQPLLHRVASAPSFEDAPEATGSDTVTQALRRRVQRTIASRNLASIQPGVAWVGYPGALPRDILELFRMDFSDASFATQQTLVYGNTPTVAACNEIIYTIPNGSSSVDEGGINVDGNVDVLALIANTLSELNTTRGIRRTKRSF